MPVFILSQMSKTQLILILVYVAGLWLSRVMLEVEHESEGKEITRIDRILSIVISMFSFLTILTLLISTWFKKIGATGYWAKPVKQKNK